MTGGPQIRCHRFRVRTPGRSSLRDHSAARVALGRFDHLKLTRRIVQRTLNCPEDLKLTRGPKLAEAGSTRGGRIAPNLHRPFYEFETAKYSRDSRLDQPWVRRSCERARQPLLGAGRLRQAPAGPGARRLGSGGRGTCARLAAPAARTRGRLAAGNAPQRGGL